MRCPFCRHPESRVVDSRDANDGVRRRRECVSCGRRFSTVERAELHLPLVLKKNGRREPYDREKVVRGFVLACNKRPVTEAQIEAAADRIEAALLEAGEREVPSATIGHLAVEALRDLDAVALLRFASVYNDLQSASAFLDLARSLTEEEPR
ncbi:MAG: transcriptional repressor NrdR [Deltaproteobacteria bacterium]|nr:transcriptional repressor NrdR [Deltaproteobacteria bacterium]